MGASGPPSQSVAEEAVMGAPLTRAAPAPRGSCAGAAAAGASRRGPHRALWGRLGDRGRIALRALAPPLAAGLGPEGWFAAVFVYKKHFHTPRR